MGEKMAGTSLRAVLGLGISTALGAIVFATSTPSVAQTPQQIAACEGKNNVTPDERIANCSTIISASRPGPDIAWAYANRGNAYYTKGQYDRTVQDFSEAIKLDGSRADRYYGRGRAYRSLGEYDKAIADFSTAIAGFDPSKYPAFYKRDYFNSRGGAFLSKKEYDLALADYDDAIRVDPLYADSYYNRSFAYRGKGDYERAIGDLSRAISGFDPGKFPASYKRDYLYWRGRNYADKGDFSTAVSDYSEAIQIDPTFASAFLGRARAKQKLADNAGSEADLARARQLKPGIDTE